MQHTPFSSPSPSTLATQPIVPSHFDGHQPQFQRRLKRSRKRSAKSLGSTSTSTSTVPTQSASSSSWGAEDQPEEDTPSSSESEEELSPNHHHPPAHVTCANETKPFKKRRHLDYNDVGRFASLSIDHHSLLLPEIRVKSPSPPPPPSSVHSPSPAPPSTAIKEVSATSIEEPEDDHEDLTMRARRGANIHQIDTNRFYVTSLSDDSEDEETEADRAKQDQIDQALRSGGPIDEVQDSGAGIYEVNGELINRLHLVEAQRRQALVRDRALLRSRRMRGRHSDDSGSSTPTRESKEGALILWKKPEEILSWDFGHQIAPSVGGDEISAPPPIVHEEGGYAYVRRPAAGAPRRSFDYTSSSGNSPQSISRDDTKPPSSSDAMDMDLDD